MPVPTQGKSAPAAPGHQASVSSASALGGGDGGGAAPSAGAAPPHDAQLDAAAAEAASLAQSVAEFEVCVGCCVCVSSGVVL